MFRFREPYQPPSTVSGSPETARRLALFLGIVVVAGFLGFAMENVLFGARYSKVLGGAKSAVPFLPVYAAGGAVLAAVIPEVRPMVLPIRLAAYVGSLTAVEYGACQLDRSFGKRSWEYESGIDVHGCVDVQHALAWGVLGLVVEKLAGGMGW